MAGNLVCQGALCVCNKGAAPTPLTVTSQQILTIENQLVATVMDFAPMVNVKPFGICQQLTQMAAGIPQPCVPAPTGPWSPGSQVQVVNQLKSLTADSKLACGVGGQITVKIPNCSPDVNAQ